MRKLLAIVIVRIESPPQPVTISEPHNSRIDLTGVVDAWVRDVQIADTVREPKRLEGTFDSFGQHVEPVSLYEAQLRQR